MNKFVCVHGHFYQPPRENPWLEEVELQESAHPYHDWNERISAECYARNGASRILNSQGYVQEIVNNYSQMSFNIGPTLLSWMQDKDPDAYQSVLEADRLSQKNFSGHGSAVAQVFNHIIMPLANERDKRTQIVWGIEDFRSRFKRMPEGMWLAEAAVDSQSLDIMAELGVKYTILAPHQAKRVKKISEKRDWLPEDEEHIDIKRPYLCKLPSGRTINIFFYDGGVSQAIAFEGLLHNGETLAKRIVDAFDNKNLSNQIVHLATDGESYGHHHKFGDMALSYALKYIQEGGVAKLTNYGEYLEKNPPQYEAQIVEDSSWSCVHGIERWRDNCGCNSGGNPGWNQEWRAPLREALDWLRDRAALVYEQQVGSFVKDPWLLRDQYIEVVLNRDLGNIQRFLDDRVRPELTQEDQNRVLRALEIQRNALLMYTSCGWFFDDISGIETVQIIKYAARVLQLVRRLSGQDLELDFIELLGKAKSNVPEADNGARIFKVYVGPSIVDILRVGAHYAMSSLYQDYGDEAKIYCFHVRKRAYDKQVMGKMQLVVGRAQIVSEVTLTSFDLQFVTLHLGDHNFITGVDYFKDEKAFKKSQKDIVKVFLDGDVPKALQTINHFYGSDNFSLWHLFQHEQQLILDKIFESTMGDVETSFRKIYEDHFSLIRMINENKKPLPKTLARVVEFLLNRDLVGLLEQEGFSVPALKRVVTQSLRWPFKRDVEKVEFLGGHRLNELIKKFQKSPEEISLLERAIDILVTLQPLGLELDFWKAQNIFYGMVQTRYQQKKQFVATDDYTSRWVKTFEKLGDLLKVKLS